MPGLMNTFIQRQATVLKNVLLKALLAVRGAHAAARDASANTSTAVSLDSDRSVFPRERTTPSARGSRFGFRLLLVLVGLLLGAANSVQAGTLNCGANFGGVIDGFDPVTYNTIIADNNLTLAIDSNCTIKNWPFSNGILGFPGTNINFYFPGGADYYIVFDNVHYEGLMSCNNPQNSNFWIYWAPGSFNRISDKCQEFMVPVEMVAKSNPVGETTATIGVPFTYTITAPKLGAWNVKTDTFSEIAPSSDAEIKNLVIVDDLTLAGAKLNYVTNTAYLVNVATGVRTLLNGGNPLTPGVSDSWLSSHLGVSSDALVFSYENNSDLLSVPAGYRVDIELTVVLDDDANINYAGRLFTNTAEMWFDKIITYTRSDGSTGATAMTDLHAWPGTTPPMTIVAPDLVVNKSSTVANLNIDATEPAPFTIDVRNAGGTAAWGATIVDTLPTGMCDNSPLTLDPPLTARIFAADGVTAVSGVLQAGVDYTVTYSACKLTLVMLETSAALIEPTQRLIINYSAKFDVGVMAGPYTNVAVASSWFNDASTNGTRMSYSCPLPHNGTEGVADCQDAYTINAAAAGYYFLKTVENLSSGTFPATTAMPGDTLRYTLHIQNYTQPTLEVSEITDTLDATAFDVGTLAIHAAGTNLPVTPTATGITIPPFEVAEDQQYQVQFDVTLKSTLEPPLSVSNQAYLSGTYPTADPLVYDGILTNAPSDDPYAPIGTPVITSLIDAAATPSLANPTVVQIVAPGALMKQNPANNTQTTVKIGEQFTYLVTVPAVPSDVPLYDVRIHDNLADSAADLRFISVAKVSGAGAWAPQNTGDDKNLVIRDTATGIDILPGDQAVIAITVVVENTETNLVGLGFINSAYYTYSRIDGDTDPQLTGGADSTDPMTIVEPAITVFDKGVANITNPGASAAGGDTLEYTLTVVNGGNSDAYDINVTDFLPAELALVAGSATAEINGGGAIVLSEPAIIAPNTLIWGRDSGDILHIPVGGQLVLTYRVTVQEITSASLINSAWIDWSSLEGTVTLLDERSGDGCGFNPIQEPDHYCAGAATATIATLDTNAIAKTIASDTWDTAPSTGADAIARVGDVITYQLTLTLREGLTRNVSISDVLDPGLAFVDVVSINGVMAAPYSQAGVFSYAAIPATSVPAVDATGTLTWTLGDITNAVDNNTANDTLVIVYRARVQHGAAEAPTVTPTETTLKNQATLGYTYADGVTPVPIDPTRMQDSASLTVRQPQITEITKTGVVVNPPVGATGDGFSEATAFTVDVLSSRMDFSVEACNSGWAPAYGVVITDQLAAEFDGLNASTPVVKIGASTLTAGVDYAYIAPTTRPGEMHFTLNTALDPGACVTITYNVGFHTDVAPDQTWSNQAAVGAYWSLPPSDAREYIAITPVAASLVWMTNAFTAELPTKTVTNGEATIGEDVTYQITVPGAPVNAALDTVVITDTLDARLQYQSYTQISGPAVTDNIAGQNLSFSVGQIPAGEQVVIQVTARVVNSDASNAPDTVDNFVTYTYDGAPAVLTSVTPAAVTLVEPVVTMLKAVSNITTPGASAAGGDTLEYTLTLTNSGSSIAHDVNVSDILPAELAFVAGSATAQINGSNVIGFNAVPTTNAPNTLVWGRDNGDDTLDIPVGGVLELSFRVTVQQISAAVIINNAWVDWTSLDGAYPIDPATNPAPGRERTGAGCPTVAAPNDYCTSAMVPIGTVDTNTIAKSVVSDSWDSGLSTAADEILRVGDTVVYRLAVTLREGLTESVVATDTLSAGLAFDSVVSVNGDTTADYSQAGVFSYADIPAGNVPAAGATGALAWTLGDITNLIDNNTANNTFVIEYRARVVTDTLAHADTTPLTNNVALSYTGGDPLVNPLLFASADIDVRQPIMSAITKTGNGASNTVDTALNVNVATDTVQFQLQSCNTDGLAPAYSVTFADVLATELDETKITAMTVAVGGSTLGAGDYSSAYTAIDRTMTVVLNTPVNPGQCATVNYTIGFHADVAPNSTWNNSATLKEYWSLPLATGQMYGPLGPSQFYMTNLATIVAPTKTVVTPTTGEITIGELVTYQITVPGAPVNATLNDVIVSDTLDPSIVFVDSTVVLNGAATAIVAVQSGQDLSWTLPSIPADQQAVITLTARVVNSAGTNAGNTFANSASYTYDDNGTPAPGGSSDPATATLAIVEPLVVVDKTVPMTAPQVGDVLTYTLALTASGNVSGDIYSNAYDVSIVDALSLGMAYVPGSAMVAGNPIEPSPITGNGIDTPQVLTWNAADINLDIPEGTQVTVTYQVEVLDTVGTNQALRNDVRVEWTGLAGVNPDERTGTETPAYNDYFATDFTVLTTPMPLLKQNQQDAAAVGEQFTYRITVPATPVSVDLHDVRILDDLTASAAELRFVSVARVSGSGTWTPVNTGSATNLVIEDTVNGIDIPAGGQVVIDVTVELLNEPVNAVGLTFTNTASYTFNQVNNTSTSQTSGLPGTTAPMTIVGLNSQKTVAIDVDTNGNNLVDPGDVLIYTITVNNLNLVPVTGVVLTDDVPEDTDYVADSVMLNGSPVAQPDGGISPLIAGIPVNSTGSVIGTIAANASAVVTFKVQVRNDGTVPTGTVISNQGYVTSNQVATEPTDADGDSSNGYQPTTIVVGSAQQVAITKEVFVVGGGVALPGSQLEYVVRATNIGVVDATAVAITDNLAPLAGMASYVVGSAALDGPGSLAVGGGSNPTLTADIGGLAVGASRALRFRVLIADPLAEGTTLSNTAQLRWNTPVVTMDASVSIDIGGVLGTAMLSGRAWHDANFDDLHDSGEAYLAGWTVGLYRGAVQIASTTTDANGLYSFTGLAPTLTDSGRYELRFTAPGAGPNTAKLGEADSSFSSLAATPVAPIDGMQLISNIEAVSGSNVQNLNLPIDPNGVVFDSIVRSPIAGATLTMVDPVSNTPLPGSCFDDTVQQGQVTLASGFYKFDLKDSCLGNYVIRVTPPATGYTAGPSVVIPPVTNDPAVDAAATPYSVASCQNDALGAPVGYCEAMASETVPVVPATSVVHHLYLTLSTPVAGASQLFNNHIPVDPTLESALTISKTSSLVNVSRGQLVPYTITLNNTLGADLTDMTIVDTFPPGFKYVEGSSRINGLAVEPVRTNRQLSWSNLQVSNGTPLTIKLLFIVGSGVSEGEYVNRAQTFHTALSGSGEATATVRVIPDPTFDCTDVIGKVFDDVNRNGYQDAGEKGLPGVRVVSARGLLVTADEHGRFHITCAVTPDANRGSNFILKVDDRTLPTGYRITTENPRVQRATRGKMMKFNFGAAINKIVRLDIANGVFEPETTEMRMQWKTRMDLLLGELKKAPSILRLAYMAEVEDEKLVEARLKAMKQEIEGLWAQQAGAYELVIETEVFWRLGAPPSRSKLK